MNTLCKAAKHMLEVVDANQYAVANQAPHGDVMAYNAAANNLRTALKQEEEASAWLAERKEHWRKEREKAQATKDQDPELSAALGWPGGISDPVLDRTLLLQMVAALRLASQQALEALDGLYLPGELERVNAAITALRGALAQQAEPVEPVARECSDPMCACRGGPCAGCEEGQREKEIEDLRSSLDFYKRRCEAIKSWQSKMRDPERTIVCDILANGFTLDPAFAGDRYTAPPKAEPAQEPGAWVASKDGRVIYDDASTDDGLLRVSGDFEDDEQRVRYAQRIVDKLNAAPPQRTMVPLTEEEIAALVRAEIEALPSYPSAVEELPYRLARAVEKAVWEKNHGQA